MSITLNIIVLVVITAIIFVLMFLSFHMMLKSEKSLVSSGFEDKDIKSMIASNKKHRKSNIAADIISYVVMSIFIVFSVFSISLRANNNAIWVNNSTSLVVGSNSMASVNESNEYITEEMKSEEFSFGDILLMNEVPSKENIRKYNIYAYRSSSGEIIIHRLYSFDTEKDYYVFRGDANNASDKSVKYEDIIGEYTFSKISGIGVFILFSQSLFGIYTVGTLVALIIISSVYDSKLSKLYKERYIAINTKYTVDHQGNPWECQI